MHNTYLSHDTEEVETEQKLDFQSQKPPFGLHVAIANSNLKQYP